MPAPSPLAIATSSVERLLKEEKSYHQELAQQEAQVKALEDKIKARGAASEDGNDEFMLKQQQTAVEQTRAVFAPLRERIATAVTKLEEQIATSEESNTNAADLETAKAVLARARAA
ncbi:tubulin folding cofactor A [Purpureocillium takamizusanense]|uniref:Tubulin-specific chaperone A n=1 Tax=Purpureocillium takamizusanense TaxID=2060973 RepID=A0A9Q8Q976_9HYPO|nr:tubulin folding cofactor A [Purpureocillium takamizusanense]UNI14864.1 tubulin folding cofactor A [Purpureocillium takamizusanense]